LAAMEVGRICVKTVGREAGKKCIIVDIVDKNFVLITGANINHLEPTQEKIDVNRGATDEEVNEALKAADKLDEMAKTVKPTLS